MLKYFGDVFGASFFDHPEWQGEEVFPSRPGSRTPRVSCRSALKNVSGLRWRCWTFDFFTRFPVVSLRSAAHVPFGSKVSGIGVGVAGAALPSSLARCKGLCQLDQFALRSPEGDV